MGQLPLTSPADGEPAGTLDVMGADTSKGGGTRQSRADDQPVLPNMTRDERDVGWGDERAERDEDWYRRERPPHHE